MYKAIHGKSIDRNITFLKNASNFDPVVNNSWRMAAYYTVPDEQCCTVV